MTVISQLASLEGSGLINSNAIQDWYNPTSEKNRLRPPTGIAVRDAMPVGP